jgi:hypothetical protein
MRVCLKYILIVCVISLISETVSAQVKVSAQVDRGKDIYVGENFGYYIVIEGAEKPGQVNLEPLREYQPKSTGNRQQSSTQIINNKVTTSRTIIMTYSLTANAEGRIQLPPVTVTIDGKSYQTNPVQVNISKPGTTEQLDLEVTLSEKQCYVGQPVIMTIKFYISADIGDFQFNIPAFREDIFYIEEPDISNPQAREYSLGNGITVRVSQTRTIHKGKESILLSFSKVLIPKQSGEIEIPQTSVSADVAVGRARPDRGFFDDGFFDGFFGSQKQYKRFMVSSQPLKLTVLPLPEGNKPNGFYGLVGRYTISASAAPTKVSVGDPITLTIKIGGSRYLKPVQWPALKDIPGLVDNFKIPLEQASPTIEDGFKIFTQTIRANNDKVTAIPSIPLAYFDTEKGDYTVAKTEPIELEVSPSKILTGADLEGRDFTAVNKEVEAIMKGLSANFEGLDALENQGFSPLAALIQPGYLLIWAGPLVLVILSAVAKFSINKTPEKIARKRRRSAAGKAINQLRKIASSEAGQHEQLAMIIKQYIGERFDKSAGALTSNDCFEIIAEATKDTQLSNKYKEIIADCEAARYASAKSNIGKSKIEEIINLIRTVEKKSGK